MSHRSSGRRSERTQGPSKIGCVKLKHEHMHQGSPLLLIFLAFILPNLLSQPRLQHLSRNLHRHPSAAQGHLHGIYSRPPSRHLFKATFTASIQPKLDVPGPRKPLTSAINILLAIRYSSILSTFPNHLNTL